MHRDVATTVPERFSDPEAVTLMNDAREAGFKVAVLTNDGVGIAGKEFFDSRPEFQTLDAFVDAREFDQPKPLAESYVRTAQILGVDPAEVVFLDNAPACVEGARDVGMTGVLVDPADKRPAFDLTRQLLRIDPETRGVAARACRRAGVPGAGPRRDHAAVPPRDRHLLERRTSGDRPCRGATVPRRDARDRPPDRSTRPAAVEDAPGGAGRHDRRRVGLVVHDLRRRAGARLRRRVLDDER